MNEAPAGQPLLICAPSDEQDAALAPDEDGGELSEILFEQLGYLIKYAYRERQRLYRVMAILLETFN